MVKNLPANAGDAGSIPGSEIYPGEGNGDPFQYSCWGNPMDRGAWRAEVHGSKRWTQLRYPPKGLYSSAAWLWHCLQRICSVIIQSVSPGARTKLAITPKCLGGGVSIYIPMLALELKNLPDTCMTELFCCPPETVTTLLISYTPI